MSTRRRGERAASRGHSGLLDDVGKRIVELLQSDGRRSYASVGTEVGLSGAAEALTAMDEVTYVVTTAGSFDILAEVVCEDDDELLDLLSRRIRALPGVQHTETFVYLKLNKQHYNWGTR